MHSRLATLGFFSLAFLFGCDPPIAAEIDDAAPIEPRATGENITACCQCLTDGQIWIAQCNSALCNDECVAGDMTKGCYYDDSRPIGFELYCPFYECGP